jgi:hypothetical protein
MTDPRPAADPQPATAPRSATGPQPDRREPLGVTVCRLCLDPVRGRIRHPLQVGIAIRAAMFIDLALAGRIVGSHGPEALGDSSTGNPLPDAVHRAVAAARPLAWRRWFNHVHADRTAAVDHLLATGQWRLEGRRIVDPLAAETALAQQDIRTAVRNGSAPPDLQTAILRLLVGGAGGAGRPMPRACWKLAKAWLPPQLAGAGSHSEPVYQTVRWSLRAMRRAAPFRVLSG